MNPRLSVWPFVLLLMIAAPPAAAGPDQDREADLKTLHDDVMRQIRAREKEYEREQEKLKETRKEASALARKERQLFKKLEAADKALSRTRSELTLLTKQMETLQKDIEITQEKWAAEHMSLSRQRDLLSLRLKTVSLVFRRAQGPGSILMFKDASIPARRALGLVRAAESDRERIGRIRTRKMEIEKVQDLLKSKEASLRKVQEKKLTVERRQERERKRREELVQEARSRKSAADEMSRRLEEESANMKILLTSLREKSLKLKERLAYLKKEFEDKKGLLKWPVESRGIKSIRSYGKFFDETIRDWRVNKGIDIVTETNQNIVAVSKGEVVFADFLGRMGNLVILDHGGDYFTLYAHLSEIGVKLGAKVETGDVIGRAGNTGLLEDRAVLHFEIRQGSQAVDPENWLGRRSSTRR